MYLVATGARTQVAPCDRGIVSSEAHRETYETAHQTTRRGNSAAAVCRPAAFAQSSRLVIKRFPRLLWLVVSTPALACTASHKSITARRTPCKLHEIEISNEAYEADRETWAASCGGKRYACSTTGLERRVVYACRVLEEPNAPQEATSAASDTGGGVNAASSAPRAESAPASSTQDARVDAASRAPRAESAPASSTDAPGP